MVGFVINEDKTEKWVLNAEVTCEDDSLIVKPKEKFTSAEMFYFQ